MNPLRERSWSPYVAGAGIGALSALAFATADRPLGVSGAFEDAAAAAIRKLAPARYRRYVEARGGEEPRLDWEAALVAGVALGSYLSSRASGDRGHPTVPPGWAGRFGPSPAKRYAAAFAGAALMMFGARLARGCTSGHAISGTLQFAGSSWTFSPLMAVAAASTARALYGRDAREARR